MSEIKNGDMADAQQAGGRSLGWDDVCVVLNGWLNKSGASFDDQCDLYRQLAALTSPAKVGGDGPMTDAAIKAIADRYASFVSVGVYDETRYDCREDFYNFCRELMRIARSSEDGYEPQEKQYSGLRLQRLAKAIGAESVIPEEWSPEDVDAGRVSILGMLAGHAERAALTSPAKVGGDEREVQSHFERQGWEVLPIHTFSELTEAIRDYVQARAALSADGGEDKRDAEIVRLRGQVVELNEALHVTDLCEDVSQDALRLDFMAHHGASLRNDPNQQVGWYVVIPYHTGTVTDVWLRHATPREAIDAAIAANQAVIPEQPPVDNAFVLEGCEKFSAPGDAS